MAQTTNTDGQPTDSAQFTELQQQLQAREAEINALKQASDAEIAALKQANETTNAALVQATERVQAIEKARRTDRFTSMIASEQWFGERAAHMTMLDHLADTVGEDSPVFKSYLQQQRATAELMRQSNLFIEIGSDGGGGQQSAWSKIETKAKALAESKGITVEQATEEVLKSDSKLYAEYRAEQ